MSMIESAASEMKIAGFSENEIGVMRQILGLFFETWDSGGAVWAMAPVLQRCIAGKCLTPLTGADSEWSEASGGNHVRQNLRCGTVFSDETGRCYDIDTPGRPTITFPYWPDRAEVADPVIEFGTDDGA